MGHVDGGEGEDGPGQKSGYWVLDIGYSVLGSRYWRRSIRQYPISNTQYPPRQQVNPIPRHRPTKKDDGVVGNEEAAAQLQREGEQAVEGVEGVKVETDAGGVVEQVGDKRSLLLVDQGGFQPPEVPVVLPAVKAVAGDGGGQLRDQWPGHDNGEQAIAQEN